MCRSVVPGLPVGNPWGIGRCREVTSGKRRVPPLLSTIQTENCAVVYGNIGIATISNHDEVLAEYYFNCQSSGYHTQTEELEPQSLPILQYHK